jgi:hypothetical protein
MWPAYKHGHVPQILLYGTIPHKQLVLLDTAFPGFGLGSMSDTRLFRNAFTLLLALCSLRPQSEGNSSFEPEAKWC